MSVVYRALKGDQFSVQMSKDNPFGGNEADKTNENTINRDCKTWGGYVGFSANFTSEIIGWWTTREAACVGNVGGNIYIDYTRQELCCYNRYNRLLWRRRSPYHISKSVEKWLKSLVSIGAMHWAESFNNRALIRSSPIALLVFKFFNCLRTKDSVILQKENDLLLPLDREKAGGKNFLELPAISRSFSLILAASLVLIWEKCVFRTWAISLVSVLKHRLPQLKI